MQYGKEVTVSQLDDQGSLHTKERNVRAGDNVYPIRHHWEMRIKVKNDQQELQEYLAFSDELKGGKKLDPAFRIEGKDSAKPFYYVVKCWTELEK